MTAPSPASPVAGLRPSSLIMWLCPPITAPSLAPVEQGGLTAGSLRSVQGLKPGKPLARARGESHCYWPPMQALRFFFSITLDKPGLLKALFRVQGPQNLPTVLTQEEVARLLDAAALCLALAATAVGRTRWT